MSATHDNAGIAAWRFNMKAEVRSYADAERVMAELGDGLGFAKIGPHMTLIHEGSENDPDQAARTYAVELYSTKILRFYPDGTFSVDNGGFNTPTTRERLQAVVPDGFMVYHHAKALGLLYTPDRRMAGHPADGKNAAVLWPLDHTKRISPTTITVVPS